MQVSIEVHISAHLDSTDRDKERERKEILTALSVAKVEQRRWEMNDDSGKSNYSEKKLLQCPLFPQNLAHD